MLPWNVTYLEITTFCVFILAHLVNGETNYISCNEGSAQSFVYAANYTVKKRPHLFSCNTDSDTRAESTRPPGTPRILEASCAESTLTLSWSPPDDGSVDFLTGFLVQMFADSVDYFSIGPSVCYTVQLSERPDHVRFGVSESQLGRDPDVPLPQDSVFRLSCSLSGADNFSPVTILVTSFPLPNRNTDKTAQVSVDTCDKTTTQSVDTVAVRSLTAETIRSSKLDLVPIVTISAGVLVVMVTAAVVIVTCNRKKRQQSNTTDGTFSADSAMANNTRVDTEISEHKLTEHVGFTPTAALLDIPGNVNTTSPLSTHVDYADLFHSTDEKIHHVKKSNSQEFCHGSESVHYHVKNPQHERQNGRDPPTKRHVCARNTLHGRYDDKHSVESNCHFSHKHILKDLNTCNPSDTVRNGDHWSNNPCDTVRNGDHWSNNPCDTVRNDDHWSNNPCDTVRNGDHWSNNPCDTVRNGDHWSSNGQCHRDYLTSEKQCDDTRNYFSEQPYVCDLSQDSFHNRKRSSAPAGMDAFFHKHYNVHETSNHERTDDVIKSFPEEFRILAFELNQD